ncbi:GntR family transcriptional regulator [Lentisphaerota bacterium ZTH]|nr:GntR family transcriptional regulator [Lentisphaerota bacterium]WET05372.1 GntR family transcriptional regulator [Lentisphaerota bacterium ZTH]
MKLKRYSLAEQAYREMLKQIISGQWQAGDKMTEESLCEHFKISRTPAREALMSLTRDGLVERQPRCGWRICSPTTEQVYELFECRRQIECLALKSAIDNIPEEKLEALKEALLSETESPKRISLQVDDDLHQLIADHCGNSYLKNILERLSRQSSPFRYFRTDSDSTEKIQQERLTLIEEMLNKNTDKALKLLSDHIAQGRKILEDRKTL